MTNRHAYTLIEVMIVLSIAVGVVAIAWPRMRGLAAATQLREAAVQIKAACVEARQEAARSGRPVTVRYRIGHPEFQIRDAGLPDHDPDDRISIATPRGDDPQAFEAQPIDWHYRLPPGIRFDDPERRAEFDRQWPPDGHARSDSFALASDDLRQAGGSQIEPDWTESERVTFFPDGRGTAATVRLAATDSGEWITLTVRALTGGVSIGQVERHRTGQRTGEQNQPDGESRSLSPAAEASDDGA